MLAYSWYSQCWDLFYVLGQQLEWAGEFSLRYAKVKYLCKYRGKNLALIWSAPVDLDIILFK